MNNSGAGSTPPANPFPSREEAGKLYDLGPNEELIFEINIGGPEEKARVLREMFVNRLNEAVKSRGKVTVLQAKDTQSGQIIPDRFVVVGTRR